MDAPQPVEYGNLKSYTLGFLCSLLLTLAAYFAVQAKLFSGIALDLVVGLLAIGQALIQLLLFFNLTREAKPRWNLLIFLFMIMVVIVIVGGSLWIMNHLNYNLMEP